MIPDLLPILRLWAVHVAGLAALAAVAWAVGEAVLGRLGPGDGLARRSPWATALGIGIVAQAIGVLGALGGLRRPLVLALLALLALLAGPTWRRGAAATRTALADAAGRRRVALGVALGAAVATPMVAMALYPETEFDALNYHLPYVTGFLAAERLVALPDLRYPVFPQLGEMLFVAGFALVGETLARLTQTLAVLVTGGLLLTWGGSGAGDAERWRDRWAAALWLGTPLAVWLGSMAYVDAGMALFATAAVGAAERWRRGAGDGSAAHGWAAHGSAARGWAALAGAFAGFAAATKYLGLFFVGALPLVLLAARGRRRGRPLALFLVAAALAAGPWYARLAAETGNPVFPFYPSIFGDSAYTIDVHDDGAATTEEGTAAVDDVLAAMAERVLEGVGFLAAVPWNAVFARHHFAFEAPLTPFLLVLLPLGLLPALADASLRRPLLLAVAYGLFWLTAIRDLRFLLAVVPLVALAAAGGLAALPRLGLARRPRLAAALTVLFLAPGPLYAVYKTVEKGWWPADEAGRRAHLRRWVPGYPALEEVEAREGDAYALYALGGERLRHPARGRVVGDWFGPARYSDVLALLGDGPALRRHLDGLGVCYLLATHGLPGVPLPAATVDTARLEELGTRDGTAVYRLRGADCR